MKIRQIAAIALFLTLTACVAQPQGEWVRAHWHRDGVSKADTESKHAQCVYNVGMNKVEETMVARLINACMQADGFRWINTYFRPYNSAPQVAPQPHAAPQPTATTIQPISH